MLGLSISRTRFTCIIIVSAKRCWILHRHVTFTFLVNQRTVPTRTWSKRLLQRGGLGPHGGEVLSTFYLLFQPRPKFPTQHRIVAARGAYSCPRDEIFTVKVFNLGGCSTIERSDNTHRGRIEDQTEQELGGSTFARSRYTRNDTMEAITYGFGLLRVLIGR